MIDSKGLVPKKGLEPPHPCEYMDLNHARLPIPPLRHGTALKRFALKQAATLSLANAHRGVKFEENSAGNNSAEEETGKSHRGEGADAIRHPV